MKNARHIQGSKQLIVVLVADKSTTRDSKRIIHEVYTSSLQALGDFSN